MMNNKEFGMSVLLLGTKRLNRYRILIVSLLAISIIANISLVSSGMGLGWLILTLPLSTTLSGAYVIALLKSHVKLELEKLEKMATEE